MSDFSDVAQLLGSCCFKEMIEAVDRRLAEEIDAMTESRCYHYIGIAHYYLGNYAEAIHHYNLALVCTMRNSAAHCALAYVFACCPDACFHNGRQAVLHAKLACRHSNWQRWEPVQNLVASFLRSGDFVLAATYAPQALELASEHFKWRVERLIGCIERKQPFTSTLEDDFAKLKSDWQAWRTNVDGSQKPDANKIAACVLPTDSRCVGS